MFLPLFFDKLICLTIVRSKDKLQLCLFDLLSHVESISFGKRRLRAQNILTWIEYDNETTLIEKLNDLNILYIKF